MLTMEEFDQLRPYADANFEGAPAHLIEKLDAELREANGFVFDAVPPDLREQFTGEMARTLANRANAQKSTGPKTQKGKAASSKNRLAHGLCSESLLVGGETAADFEALLASVRKAYSPVNHEEAMLTDQVAQALWRFNRAQRVETQMFQVTQCNRLQSSNLNNGADVEFKDMTQFQGDNMLTLAFVSDFDYKQIDRISRYMTTMERSYHRALKALQHAQEKRRNLPKPVVEVAEVAEVIPPAEQEKAAAATSPIQHPFDQPIEFGFESKNEAPSFVPRC
ncbi:MAG: hypothetical protein NTV52_16845 [Acidobacteria bacterium]|nr:hypothetical protein [Acidobacteriota bacterium]